MVLTLLPTWIRLLEVDLGDQAANLDGVKGEPQDEEEPHDLQERDVYDKFSNGRKKVIVFTVAFAAILARTLSPNIVFHSALSEHCSICVFGILAIDTSNRKRSEHERVGHKVSTLYMTHLSSRS